jgi:exopolyphosphatase/guanosine-5'-triphosphate,3'-diphosphate pyrophosphatase
LKKEEKIKKINKTPNKNGGFVRDRNRFPYRRYVRRKRGTYATIDLGTNNCRLLIAQPSPNSFKVVESFSRITRLGEGIIDNNELSEEAIERTISALKVCANKLKKRPVSQARHVATEACRRAKNGEEFIKRVKEETGLSLEIIPSEEESRLAVAGCVPLLNRNINHTLVFDIGGGSTEISWASVNSKGKAEIDGFISLPFGVVTVAEAFKDREMDYMAYESVIDRTINILNEFEKKHNILEQIENEDVQMIGTSGTITTLGAIHLGLNRYVRSAVDGLTLSFDEIKNVQDMLKEMSMKGRERHPCIGPDRADLTLAGCAILEAICSFWPIGEITVADRGLREGVLLDLMQKDIDRVSKKKKTGSRRKNGKS